MTQDTSLAGVKPAEFYVVSIKKLSFMYGVTMGLYLFAWFYQHWKCYQRSTGTQVLPVFRALFNGVYVFSLFSRIQQALDVSGRTYQWFPTRRAALLGIAWALPIISMVIEGDEPSFWIFILLNWGLFVACGWLLIGAQRAVNCLHNDPQGKKNRTLNFANRVWAVCGAVVWMVFILMMMLLVYVPY